MKKLIAIVLASTLSLGAVAGEDRQERRMERLSEKLELTQDQREQIKAVYDKKAAERKALKESMRQLHESTQKEVRSILTPEQQEKFDEMKEQRKEKHKKWKDKHSRD